MMDSTPDHLGEALSLRQPRAIVDSWQKTVAFAHELKRLEPIFLYYWSPEDKAIIANRCEIAFAPETGIEFTFFNPQHPGPNALVKNGEIKFSGPLRLIGNIVTFEVFSHEPIPEPASGIGLPGKSNTPVVARGKMVGLQTRVGGHDEITQFKFILLSNPQPRTKLQKTDRIASEGVPDPLAAFFAEELLAKR